MLSDNPDNCNFSKSNNVNKHETSFSKSDSNYCQAGTCAIIGNLILNGINEKQLSMNNRSVKVFYFSWTRIRGISQHMSIIKKKPELFILHIGTNDATTNDSRKIVNDILLLKSAILKSLPDCRIIVSKPIFRSNNEKVVLTIRNLNKQIECIENGNI